MLRIFLVEHGKYLRPLVTVILNTRNLFWYTLNLLGFKSLHEGVLLSFIWQTKFIFIFY